MDKRTATETEASVVKRVAERLQESLPDTYINYVARVQEPGEVGLLLGLNLPTDVQKNSPQALTLFDIVHQASTESRMPLGLSAESLNVSAKNQSAASSRNMELLSIDFLPANFRAPIYGAASLHRNPDMAAETLPSDQLRLRQILAAVALLVAVIVLCVLFAK